jgi:hypothetical protein
MERQLEEQAEPPSSARNNSFPARAFGRATSKYSGFLEALLEGLTAFEAAQGGRTHAGTPLPAA